MGSSFLLIQTLQVDESGLQPSEVGNLSDLETKPFSIAIFL